MDKINLFATISFSIIFLLSTTLIFLFSSSDRSDAEVIGKSLDVFYNFNDIENDLINSFDDFKKSFVNDDFVEFSDSFSDISEKDFVDSKSKYEGINYAIRNTYIENIEMSLEITDQQDLLKVGKMHLQQRGCLKQPYLDILLDDESEKFVFGNLESLIGNTCRYSDLEIDEILLNCIDCTLAPVDKLHQLPPEYVPSVSPLDTNGGGFLTKESRSAINQLISDAESNEIYTTLTSSFRSYDLQQNVYDRRLMQELGLGYTPEEAEDRTNSFVAEPGHSEHQLGTTVDISCLRCQGQIRTRGNEILYEYLEQNAHLFGFVISYPASSVTQTGYNYEPWHLRYIGTEHATILFEMNYISEPDVYLSKYLRKIAKY